jgi:hypothetical protein
MTYTKAQEPQLIQDLEAWFLNEPTLKPLFKSIKDEAFTPALEFSLFLDNIEHDGVYGTDVHSLGFCAFTDYADDPNDMLSYESALTLNQEHLLARLIGRLHRNVFNRSAIKYPVEG